MLIKIKVDELTPHPIKMGRCIKEFERVYGVSHGGDRKSSLNFSNLKTQGDIASE